MLERGRQDDKWGPQSHENGTSASLAQIRELARAECDQAFAMGAGTWRHILDEEIAEANAETNSDALYVELTQVAAVAVAWMQDLLNKKAS